MLKHVQIWLPAYLRTRFKPKPSGRPIHVMFCVADHYEPDAGGADVAEQLARVERWVSGCPTLAGRHRDADGRPPRYSAYSAEDRRVLEGIEALTEFQFFSRQEPSAPGDQFWIDAFSITQ